MKLYAVKLVDYREVGIRTKGRKLLSIRADAWLGSAKPPRAISNTLRDAYKFATQKAAERAAFFLVATHPTLLGKVEVRQAVAYQPPSAPEWRWRSKPLKDRS